MKKVAILVSFSLSFIFASPAVMGGITYNFGDGNSKNALSGAGATIKVLSTSKEKKAVVGAGISYFPWATDKQKLGLDVSAGYNFKKGAVMAGWDFLKKQPNVSLGYNKSINTDTENEFIDGIQDARCTKNEK